MPPGKDSEKQRAGRFGGLQSWLNTDDRNERHQRMANARAKSPAADDYWLKKLFPDFPGELKDALPEQLKQIKTAKNAHFARLRQASAATVKLGRAERLRLKAAKLEAEAAKQSEATERAGTDE